jgi:two-component sensor histidine kinase/PAS domain-containing protein
MTQLIDLFLGTADVLPRGACLAWQPGLVWLRAASDAVSALACLSLTVAAVVFLRRRDLAPVARGLGVLLIAFLIAGALSHLIWLVTLWVPAYGIQSIVKVSTAAVSLGFAVAAWPQLPKLLSLPSALDLQRANAALAQTNASLETTIAWRTYELEQAKERFEMALARSNIAVFTQDRDLRFTWIYNPRLGMDPEAMLGRTTEEVAPSEGAAAASVLKRQVLATGRTATGAFSIPSRTEGMRHFDMTISPTRDRGGAVEGLLCTAVDVTEKRLLEVRLTEMAAELADAARRFELALENSKITVFEQDAELRYSFMHNPPPGTSIDDFLGRTDAEVFSAADQRKIVPAKRRVLASNQREGLEVELRVGRSRVFYDLRLEPKTGASGAVEGVVGTAVDLTERQRNEQHMRLVMRELTHRSKNLLAVVQAMARRTAATSPDVDHFVADLSSRLRAIAAAHDLLVAESWSGAEIGALLTASLSQTVDPEAPEIEMGGPPLKLSPDTAQTLGLAFHELTVNAAKYGALSVPGGRVSVTWRRTGGEVRLSWREQGGPEVTPPERYGFGRVLLDRLVGSSLGGTTSLDFLPDGLVFRIGFPDDRLIRA